MKRSGIRHPLMVALAVAVAVIGLSGAYRYWESYYQHRGFNAVVLLPHAHRGHLLTVNFYSPALGRVADYLVYLPPGYEHGHRRYPVYYVLHGSPGRPEVYLGIASEPTRMDDLISQHRMRPMILVFPDGRIGGSTLSDSEWANTTAGRYSSFLIDVVTDLDHRFRTLADRRARVIAGFSAGAYAAANVTLHNLGTFASLQGWSGYYTQTRVGVFAHASRAAIAYNSPLVYARKVRAGVAVDPVRAFLFVGRIDENSPQTVRTAKALAAAGVSVSYALYRGGHDWGLWHAHLNQMLVLASRDTVTPLPRPSGIAQTLTPGVVAAPRAEHPRPDFAAILTNLLVYDQRHLGHHRRRARHRHLHHRHRRNRHPVTHAAAATSPSGPRPVVLYGRSGGGGRSATTRRDRRRGRSALGELVGGLVLALASSALINIGFLLQHRGLRRREDFGAWPSLRAALRDRSWLAGQALGWVGFATQIVAVAIAPLSLVQAFAAGGLALSVPLAAGIFGHRITRAQRVAVLLIAAALATLPLGFSTAQDRLGTGALIAAVVASSVVALAISRLPRAWAKATAAGIFYGVADAAIKAISVGWRLHGAAALLSGWTAVVVLGTLAGFIAFQAALRTEGAVSAISLMTAFAALVALGCGLLAFGESLGGGFGTALAHLLAICVVLACVPVLAAAQAAIVESGHDRDPRAPAHADPVPAG